MEKEAKMILRLTKVERIYPRDEILRTDDDPDYVIARVTFEGFPNDSTECSFTLNMKERADDCQMLEDAHGLLLEAVAIIHADLQQSAPKVG